MKNNSILTCFLSLEMKSVTTCIYISTNLGYFTDLVCIYLHLFFYFLS